MTLRHTSLVLVLLASGLRAAEVSDADKRIVQTVQRLGSFDYAKASPKTREAINRYLDATAGSEEYFSLVGKFHIADQEGTLLKIATSGTGTPAAGQAVKLLLELGKKDSLQTALTTLPPEAAGTLLESLASVGSQEAVAMAATSLSAPATAPDVRQRIVRALGLSAAGQQALLEAARTGTLPEDARETAAAALTTSTEEAVRTAAATLFQMAARKPLPPVAVLAARTGDPHKGQLVFQSFCFTCHQVNGAGIEFGPALSEIGSKLAREALYDSILHPSAAISFGFEGFEVRTATGETYIGMVASETAAELALRVPGGVIQKIAKSDLTSKTPLGVSLMTPGLETVMEEDQLVDLVEYLAGLKKPG